MEKKKSLFKHKMPRKTPPKPRAKQTPTQKISGWVAAMAAEYPQVVDEEGATLLGKLMAPKHWSTDSTRLAARTPLSKFIKYLQARRSPIKLRKALATFANVDGFIRETYSHSDTQLGNMTNFFKGFLDKLMRDGYSDLADARGQLADAAKPRVKKSTASTLKNKARTAVRNTGLNYARTVEIMRDLREKYIKSPTRDNATLYMAIAVDVLMPIRRTSDWSQAKFRIGGIKPQAKEAWTPIRGAATDEDLSKSAHNLIWIPEDATKPVTLIFGRFKTVKHLGVWTQPLTEAAIPHYTKLKQMLPGLDPVRLGEDLREIADKFSLRTGDSLFPAAVNPKKPLSTAGFNSVYRRALIAGGFDRGDELSHGDVRQVVLSSLATSMERTDLLTDAERSEVAPLMGQTSFATAALYRIRDPEKSIRQTSGISDDLKITLEKINEKIEANTQELDETTAKLNTALDSVKQRDRYLLSKKVLMEVDKDHNGNRRVWCKACWSEVRMSDQMKHLRTRKHLRNLNLIRTKKRAERKPEA